MIQPGPFKWRHFQAEIILPCVRRYPRYSPSYYDLEEMMKAGIINILITDHITTELLMRYESDEERNSYLWNAHWCSSSLMPFKETSLAT